MLPAKKTSVEQLVFRCAGPNCGQLKGDANHWWLMWPSKEGELAVLSICAWDEELARRDAAVCVCGEQCAQKLQSMFMANIREHRHNPGR